MKRNVYQDLLEWKAQKKRKPIVLKGTRQVGKTYLLKQFGESEFEKHHYFDFIKDKKLALVFEGSLDPSEIIKKLEIQYDIKINLNEDLIIFDEIQVCSEALTSLKYFCDETENAYIISSGSFLGTSLSLASYPVGKIKTITLYPMTYFEFLEGLNKNALLEEIRKGIKKKQLSQLIHNKAFEYLKYYFITGGLPEVIATFRADIKNLADTFKRVRALQLEILDNYTNDMAKHCGKVNAVKIQEVFKNVPLQLAKENKLNRKFVFKDVLKTRSNYEQLEDPILWLVKTGLIHKIPICKSAEQPLEAYTEHNKFKLYFFDVGLLGVMVGLEPKTIYNYDYGSYKGYFAENFVVQELAATLKQALYSWQEGTSEIELLLSFSGKIYPLEVKAGINTKAKSLVVYSNRYHPEKTFLFSGSELRCEDNGKNYLPLYAAGLFIVSL